MTDTSATHLYSGRATNWTALGLTTVLAISLLVLGLQSGGSWTEVGFLVPVVVIIATAVINLVTASSVRAIAGPSGVAVHLGVFGWPRFRYPLARIRDVEAIEIPKSWWAWGIMWSPRRGLMLTLRNGPALRLTLTSGRRIIISTPQPDDAVRVIEVARRPLYPS